MADETLFTSNGVIQSSGGVLLTASAGPTVLDSFEDNNLNEYTGDSASFNTGSVGYIGTYAATSQSNFTAGALTRTDKTISTGETEFGMWHYNNTSSRLFGTNYSGETGFLFAVQSATGISNLDGYIIKTRSVGSGSEQAYYLGRYDGGSLTKLTDTGDSGGATNVPAETWHKIVVTEWDSSGNIRVEIRDTNGNTVVFMEANDSNYSSGGIGIVNASPSYDSGGEVRFDYIFKNGG